MKMNREFIENINFVASLKTWYSEICLWILMAIEETCRTCTPKLMATVI